MSLCVHAAGVLLGKKTEMTAVSRAKFIKPVVPQMREEVRLTPRAADMFLAELVNARDGQKISQIIFSVKDKEQL